MLGNNNKLLLLGGVVVEPMPIGIVVVDHIPTNPNHASLPKAAAEAEAVLYVPLLGRVP
jgi:hypothetical protein